MIYSPYDEGSVAYEMPNMSRTEANGDNNSRKAYGKREISNS